MMDKNQAVECPDWKSECRKLETENFELKKQNETLLWALGLAKEKSECSK